MNAFIYDQNNEVPKPLKTPLIALIAAKGGRSLKRLTAVLQQHKLSFSRFSKQIV